MYVCRLCFANRLEFLVVCDVKIGAHVVSVVPEVDLETLVSKDTFIVSKDRIREFGIELGQSLETAGRRLDKADLKSIVRIRRPYSELAW